MVEIRPVHYVAEQTPEYTHIKGCSPFRKLLFFVHIICSTGVCKKEVRVILYIPCVLKLFYTIFKEYNRKNKTMYNYLIILILFFNIPAELWLCCGPRLLTGTFMEE